jgi:hypothetical protein
MCRNIFPEQHRLRIPLHVVKRLLEEHIAATSALITHYDSCKECTLENFCKIAVPLYEIWQTAKMRARLCPQDTYVDEDPSSNPDLPQECPFSPSL